MAGITIQIRMGEQDLERLDRLVPAVRSYYERLAETVPAAGKIAEETTRSSAIRDLLYAWDICKADELFSRSAPDQD